MPSNSKVFKQLRLVSTTTIIILIFSLIAVFYSSFKLIDNSKRVAHTGNVLLLTEDIYSSIREAESNQRGYILTRNESFFRSFQSNINDIEPKLRQLESLVLDNSSQVSNTKKLHTQIHQRKEQMYDIIDFIEGIEYNLHKTEIDKMLLKGNDLTDVIKAKISEIRTIEQNLMNISTDAQNKYVNYTSFFLLFTSLFIISTTIMSFLKIRKELENRVSLQKKMSDNIEETRKRIGIIEKTTHEVSDGNYSVRLHTDTENQDELGRIMIAVNQMIGSIEENAQQEKIKNWEQEGIILINNSLRGETDIHSFSRKFLNEIARYTEALMATLYIKNSEKDIFYLTSSYSNTQAPQRIHPGEGLTGQAVLSASAMEYTELPADYFRIHSSTGSVLPGYVIILPLVYHDVVLAVVELAYIKRPEEYVVHFLKNYSKQTAINFDSVLNIIKMKELLEETQAQSEELQTQHSELENLNAELEAQAGKLQTSEEELRVQQEELLQSNEELEQHTKLLEQQNKEIENKNTELQQSTRYKSEFLANMSHELRTPLNSILLLSRLLSDNSSKNLSSDQVEYAKVILNSGNSLLGLIDEILDLSKIEAGKMILEQEKITVDSLVNDMKALFTPVAESKQLNLIFDIRKTAPSVIFTDKMRLEQVLKNLISNAIKFTAEGHVQVIIDTDPERNDLFTISVKDTGIGIDPSKQKLIFEAFQQADGSTKRKYGGTGLGLSISRELIRLLNGKIVLHSETGKGSEFIIHLPVNEVSEELSPVVQTTTGERKNTDIQEESNLINEQNKNKYITSYIPEPLPDDRNTLSEEDKVILIIEDDVHFAKSLMDYTRSKGYKVLCTARGDEGIELAKKFHPTGILLDLQLPVKSGWDVMDELKSNPLTRRIPVHMMSSLHVKKESLSKGAIDFIEKPFAFEQLKEIFEKIEKVISKDSKKVLILEDNPKHAKALAYFLESFDIHSELKSELDQAVETLTNEEVDCVILDMGIPDQMAYEMLDEIKKNPGMEHLPIIIFTGKSLSMKEEQKIKQYADSIVVKTAHSYKRMLDEVSLFLHLMEEQKKEVQHTNGSLKMKKLGVLEDVLHEKTVLVADDDVRNIFSLTKALEKYNMKVITAIDGMEALEKLEQNPAVDIVLLDMMMPKMDGYETAQKIRKHPHYKNIPIIAVTAKAMTGDREKCIQAGASDYITKPVDIDQLISLLRVWLYEI